MIKRQFVRFYLLLLLSCAALLWALGGLYRYLQHDEPQYLIAVDQLLQHSASIHRTEIPRQQLYLPPDVAALLDRGEVIAIEQADGHSLYYQKSLPQADRVVQLGPLPTPNAEVAPWLDLLLYGALALLFLGLLWPVFRDIRALIGLTRQFADQPAPLHSDIKAGSSLYPLAQSVERMSLQISQLIEMNEDMSRTVAHETRTPLSRMKFTLSLAAAQLEPKYQQRLQHDIEEIDQLVSNYLDFSRLEYFVVQQPLLQVDAAAFLRELEQKFDIYQQQLQLNFVVATDSCQVIQPAMQLAAQNLISNALRYASSTITVTLRRSTSHYEFVVQDDGPGVADHPDTMQRLFRRGDNSSGFGLGLYIVNKVASWHQGQLLIDNEPSGGARIAICWPVPATPTLI
ncbi:MAG TPA: hypothetical protein DCS87_12240 [Rheinheimera sp.]|nr:hypothetical protein [Rheinheimera sp.]